jgi:hypothetical protein
MYQIIDKFVSENPQEYGHLLEPMRKAASLRYKEYIRETLVEGQKKANFIRIYPARGSDIYDNFFANSRPYNKLVYKMLYTDEILKCIQSKPTADVKLAYKMDMPPNSYEQYKQKTQQ